MMTENAAALGALLGSLTLNLILLRWWHQARAEASRVRAHNEARYRWLGGATPLTAKIGDLSEGTLSHAHAHDIAEWVLGFYHRKYCVLLDGWPHCNCDRGGAA